jgi:hypothetical protein
MSPSVVAALQHAYIKEVLMFYPKGRRKSFLWIVAVIIALLMSACGGVSQDDYDTVQNQLEEQEQQVAQLQAELSDKLQELETLQQDTSGQSDEVAALEQQIADLQEQLGDTADATILIAAVPRPTSTPRPTPTPLPEDVTPEPPPPRPSPPDEYSDAVDFSFYVETLTGGSVSRYGIQLTPGCVPNAIFKRGSELVWRFEIFDMTTGKRVVEDEGTEVKINLPNGEDLSAHFSQRAGGRVPDAPWMWAAAWNIPPDYPLGGLDYTITVTMPDERTFTWQTPAIVSETTDSRVQIIE